MCEAFAFCLLDLRERMRRPRFFSWRREVRCHQPLVLHAKRGGICRPSRSSRSFSRFCAVHHTPGTGRRHRLLFLCKRLEPVTLLEGVFSSLPPRDNHTRCSCRSVAAGACHARCPGGTLQAWLRPRLALPVGPLDLPAAAKKLRRCLGCRKCRNLIA